MRARPFSTHWTPDLAYAIGLITTDGNLSNDGRHMELTSKDLGQIKNFKRILKLKAKIGRKGGSYGSENKYFRVQFGSVVFYKFLVSIGLTPNKTKTIGKIKIPDKYFADFLRGHLDGDGFTYSYWDKRWKSSFMLYTGFSSASKEHLDWIKQKVKYLYGLEGAIKYNGKSCYQLNYAKNASIKLLDKLYYNASVVCLDRKRFKIDVALGIIGNRARVLKLVNRHG